MVKAGKWRPFLITTDVYRKTVASLGKRVWGVLLVGWCGDGYFGGGEIDDVEVDGGMTGFMMLYEGDDDC